MIQSCLSLYAAGIEKSETKKCKAPDCRRFYTLQRRAGKVHRVLCPQPPSKSVRWCVWQAFVVIGIAWRCDTCMKREAVRRLPFSIAVEPITEKCRSAFCLHQFNHSAFVRAERLVELWDAWGIWGSSSATASNPAARRPGGPGRLSNPCRLASYNHWLNTHTLCMSRRVNFKTRNRYVCTSVIRQKCHCREA